MYINEILNTPLPYIFHAPFNIQNKQTQRHQPRHGWSSSKIWIGIAQNYIYCLIGGAVGGV